MAISTIVGTSSHITLPHLSFKMGQNLCGQVETENLCGTDDNLHWSYVAAKDEKYNSIDLLYDEKSCLNSKKRHKLFMRMKREFDMDKSFKKETTKNTEHLDFEDIFTGDGNTDTRQKIVSDYNSDSDVESESDDHNTTMETTCFDKPELNTFIPIHKMSTLSKSFIDIHEQPIEISRQKNIEDLSEQYSQDASALTKMNISQNLRSEIHEVPERQVVSGFLSDHICIYGKVYKEWQDGDDPYVIHQQISPICPYMNGQESENVPIHKEDGLQPRHHIDQTLVPSTTPVNQARVAAVRIPGSRGPTLPQEPNRKSQTLDQSTHGPRGSPEKQSPPQTRPDHRGSTLPQDPNRKSPTLDQSTHVPSGSPKKQSLSLPRPDLRGSTLPQEPNRKSPTLDQSTHVPSGSPEKQSLSQPRPDIRPQQRSKSTSFDSRGNSFGRSGFYIGGFGNFNWILGPLLLYYSFATSTSQPIGIKVDLQSDLVVFGETLYLKCSINDSIPNQTYIWSRRIGQSTPHAINFNSISTTDAAKFKIIDGGSTLGIKNLNEKDITEYCYYCRSKTNNIYSKCTYILDHNNTVVLPSKTAVTFPMNKTIRLQSECYPNFTFFMIIQNRVVANQTATKKDNNSLYEVDMTFNGTLKKGEQFLVVACQGNKNFTVYNSTDDQITKHKEDTDFSIGKIIGVIIGVLGVVGGIIALCIKIYKRRQHLPTTNRDRNDSNDKASRQCLTNGLHH